VKTIDKQALDRNADAIAWVIGVCAASTQDISGLLPGTP